MNKELKQLAQSARNRLIHKSENGIKKISSPLSPNIKFKVISSFDENFNLKARDVIEKDALDPIKELMDNDYYRSLDPSKKEKYLLDTIERYMSFKKQFDSELERKIVY